MFKQVRVLGTSWWDNTRSACRYISGIIVLRKPSFQSSLRKSFVANNAIDGNAKTYTHTNKDHQAWWAVDLLGPQTVNYVRLTNLNNWHGGYIMLYDRSIYIEVDKRVCLLLQRNYCLNDNNLVLHVLSITVPLYTYALYRWYPAKRALSAMRKHSGKGPFGRIPSISVCIIDAYISVKQWSIRVKDTPITTDLATTARQSATDPFLCFVPYHFLVWS